MRTNILKWRLERRGRCGPWGWGGLRLRLPLPPPPLATQFLGERRITPAFGVETLLGSRAEADAEA